MFLLLPNLPHLTSSLTYYSYLCNSPAISKPAPGTTIPGHITISSRPWHQPPKLSLSDNSNCSKTLPQE